MNNKCSFSFSWFFINVCMEFILKCIGVLDIVRRNLAKVSRIMDGEAKTKMIRLGQANG